MALCADWPCNDGLCNDKLIKMCLCTDSLSFGGLQKGHFLTEILSRFYSKEI